MLLRTGVIAHAHANVRSYCELMAGPVSLSATEFQKQVDSPTTASTRLLLATEIGETSKQKQTQQPLSPTPSQQQQQQPRIIPRAQPRRVRMVARSSLDTKYLSNNVAVLRSSPAEHSLLSIAESQRHSVAVCGPDMGDHSKNKLPSIPDPVKLRRMVDARLAQSRITPTSYYSFYPEMNPSEGDPGSKPSCFTIDSNTNLAYSNTPTSPTLCQPQFCSTSPSPIALRGTSSRGHGEDGAGGPADGVTDSTRTAVTKGSPVSDIQS